MTAEHPQRYVRGRTSGPEGHRTRPDHSRRYGRAHRRLRASLAPQVATGQVTCWRCSKLIGPREPWDLGHDDDNPGHYRGPEHSDCNRATRTPGRATAADGGDPQPTIRRWW